MMKDIEAVELGLALKQQEEFHKRKVAFEKELDDRRARIGRRQVAAREW